MTKIAIIREGKVPYDNRTPLIPKQCRMLMQHHEDLIVWVEWSSVRCYSDKDYLDMGVPVVEDVNDADILLGIKEVPVEQLIPGKTYMFFSHTHKMQPYNKGLLQAAVDKGITLIDYELLKDDKEQRLIGFGRWAGLVGAHYALLMYGLKHGAYHIKPAIQCVNLQETVDQYENIEWPSLKVVVTGGRGRVALGAIEILKQAGFAEVTAEAYLHEDNNGPVYCNLSSEHLYAPKDNDKAFNKSHFYAHPEEYKSNFERFIPESDILINCMFWDPKAPKLFEKSDCDSSLFSRMRTISDVSCDVDGSVPLTHKVTFSADPVYGYNVVTQHYEKPYKPNTIDIMAVTNLPNELPKDASRDFGKIVLDVLIPLLMHEGLNAPLFQRATIARDGRLMGDFTYLQEWLDSK